ncbi:MAG: hypothetical protein GDA36_12490 [Rhodobacteraceae bacterium]|nr:hypothetical protein [Paracoccaceae bacterium]
MGIGLLVWLAPSLPGFSAEITPFVGSYSGSAEVAQNGTKEKRDLSVDIIETGDGFIVAWVSTIFRTDGRVKESSYEIEFRPTDRDGIYSAAQKRNMFGHSVQLDPMKGEPFVWGRIVGDTLSVFSLFVDVDGGYFMQQYNRTLAEGGLNLSFISTSTGGEVTRNINAFLARQ